MAVLEVGIPSGYIVHNKTLQALVKKRQSVTSLRNAEYYADKAVLYFDYVSTVLHSSSNPLTDYDFGDDCDNDCVYDYMTDRMTMTSRLK